MLQLACCKGKAIRKNPGSSPAYDQRIFSPRISFFFHSLFQSAFQSQHNLQAKHQRKQNYFSLFNVLLLYLVQDLL